MKQISFFVMVILFVATFSCSTNKTKPALNSWLYLIVRSEHCTEFQIKNDADSTNIYIYHEGSIFSPIKGKMQIDTIKTCYLPAEKDSIALLVKDLITNPAPINNFCTEYVGKLELVICYNRQFSQRALYTSVCDWTTLSVQTKQLDAILQRRFNKNRAGRM